ncbi:PqqD family protein [Paenibacillus sp. LHD-117]|uniref:PqqD family protein n=1 Tax=Paenibacillus sp. LHD-117 TaxID=3071412 RepID=UPI0027DEB7BC|nr:PqqD family protein [Paenibacillus sp. LHD-117]MDQ6422244.1 PqqD family protein [Paenibacillus sp. LHD-117]
MMGTLDAVSRIDLSHLTVQRDGDEYTIGDPRISRFIRVPEPALYVIERADGTRTVRDIQEQILQERELDVDVLDFMTQLQALGLAADVAPAADKRAMSLVDRLAERIGALLFTGHAAWVYVSALAAVLLLFVLRPEFLPHYRDMFVLPVVGGNALFVSLIACLLIFLHECAHLLAARGVGVRARMRVNIRYIVIVAETEMTGLWGHAPAKRYFPYLAGMAWDCLLIATALLVQLATEPDSIANDCARLVILLLMLGILSQFMVFLRTDLYFVLGNATHSADLARSGRLFLRKLWRKDDDTREAWRRLPGTERRAAAWFGATYAIGIATMTVTLIIYSFPGGYTALSMAVRQISAYPVHSVPFWDGAVILLLAGARLLLYLKGARTAYRERRERRRQRLSHMGI